MPNLHIDGGAELESYVVVADFFFNVTATTEIYTYGHPLTLHDALPISARRPPARPRVCLVSPKLRRPNPIPRRRNWCPSPARSYAAFRPQRRRLLQIGRAHV